MYKLRNALLYLIFFLVYNLTCFVFTSTVKYMTNVGLQRYLQLGFFQMERRVKENWCEFTVSYVQSALPAL